MRFLLDESADARLVPWLRSMGHDVASIAGEHPASLKDREVLTVALAEERILVTDDRDFGELVFAGGLPHAGVIYLRLGEYADLSRKIERLAFVLEHYESRLGEFVVVTHRHVRVRQSPKTRQN